MDPDVELFDWASYRILDVERGEVAPQLRFAKMQYTDGMNSLEVLAYELASWCIQNQSSVDAGPSKLPLRGPAEDVFKLTRFNTMSGANVLTVLFNLDDGPIFLYHDRTDKPGQRRLAEAENVYHVVPAGSFQPDQHDDTFHIRDFSIRGTVWREFAEEMLGKAQVKAITGLGASVLDWDRLQPYLNAEKNGKIQLYYLGAGLDPPTLKFQILVCMAIDARSIGVKNLTQLYDKVHEHWEGKVYGAEWSEASLKLMANNNRMLSVGAACMLRARHFFREISRSFQASPESE